MFSVFTCKGRALPDWINLADGLDTYGHVIVCVHVTNGPAARMNLLLHGARAGMSACCECDFLYCLRRIRLLKLIGSVSGL